MKNNLGLSIFHSPARMFFFLFFFLPMPLVQQPQDRMCVFTMKDFVSKLDKTGLIIDGDGIKQGQ